MAHYRTTPATPHDRKLAGFFLALSFALASILGVACDVREPAHTSEVSGSDCVTCHLSDFELAKSPVHVQQLPLTCEDCHSYEVWKPALGSNHDEYFPLRFAHAEAGCAECHSEGFDRDMLSTECVGCHLNDYQKAVRPPHAGLPQTCDTCHVEKSFSPAEKFMHPFPLDGQHATLACTTCHAGTPPMWQGLSSSCYDCHSKDYDTARPPHDGFSKDCTTCHTTAGWRAGGATLPTANFVHDWWPLQGHHAATECTGCHLGDPPVYTGTPNTCVDCHKADYDGATNPSHDGFSTDCATCHTPAGWHMGAAGGPGFVHEWPLEGKHATAACNSCHLGDPPVYAGTPTQCVDCHKAEYDGATNPSHDNFSTDCGSCHVPTGWRGALPGPGFNHPWPLNGAHGKTECFACHVGDPPVWSGTPTQCLDCHKTERDAAWIPHDSFSTNCTDCHTETAWTPAQFDHPWPLNGAHSNAQCRNCHVGDPPVYAGTPTQCVDCHTTDRNRAQPPHDGLSTNCASCHSETAFKPANFTHPWPLTGAHQSAQCTGCHTGTPTRYAGTPQQCFDCHSDDYNRSTYPGHDTFPTDCTGCHTTTAWTPATGGVHPTDKFPISGRHNVPCMNCHNSSLGPMGKGNTDCVGCHGTEANNHQGVRGYPTSNAPNFCLDCHPSGR